MTRPPARADGAAGEPVTLALDAATYEASTRSPASTATLAS